MLQFWQSRAGTRQISSEVSLGRKLEAIGPVGVPVPQPDDASSVGARSGVISAALVNAAPLVEERAVNRT